MKRTAHLSLVFPALLLAACGTPPAAQLGMDPGADDAGLVAGVEGTSTVGDDEDLTARGPSCTIGGTNPEAQCPFNAPAFATQQRACVDSSQGRAVARTDGLGTTDEDRQLSAPWRRQACVMSDASGTGSAPSWKDIRAVVKGELGIVEGDVHQLERDVLRWYS